MYSWGRNPRGELGRTVAKNDILPGVVQGLVGIKIVKVRWDMHEVVSCCFGHCTVNAFG